MFRRHQGSMSQPQSEPIQPQQCRPKFPERSSVVFRAVFRPGDETPTSVLEKARKVVFKPKMSSIQETIMKQSGKQQREIHLPDEVWLEILANDNLNQYDLACVSRVNKQLHALTFDEAIWSVDYTFQGLSKTEWSRQANALRLVERTVLRDRFRMLHYETSDTWWHNIGEPLYYPMYCPVSHRPDLSALLREHTRKMLNRAADMVCEYVNTGSFDEAYKCIKNVDKWVKKLPPGVTMNKLKPSLFLKFYDWTILEAEQFARKGITVSMNQYLAMARRLAGQIPTDRPDTERQIAKIEREGNAAGFRRVVAGIEHFARLGDVREMMFHYTRAKSDAASYRYSLPSDLPLLLQYGRDVKARLKEVKNHLRLANSEAETGSLSGMNHHIDLAVSIAADLRIDFSQPPDLTHIFPDGVDIDGIRRTGLQQAIVLETERLHGSVASGEVLEMNESIIKLHSYLVEANIPISLTSEDFVIARERGYKQALRGEVANVWNYASKGDFIGMDQSIEKAEKYFKWLHRASLLTEEHRQRLLELFTGQCRTDDETTNQMFQLRQHFLASRFDNSWNDHYGVRIFQHLEL